jgi:hypothetical protein
LLVAPFLVSTLRCAPARCVMGCSFATAPFTAWTAMP